MDNEAIDRVKKLLERQKEITTLNREHFKISKNIASGNGITDDARKVWGQDRAIVNVPILDPVVSSICYRFDSNPFSFKIPDGIKSKCNEKELTAALSRALREICWDGISYLLAYHDENNAIRFRILDNLNVIYGKCKLDNGDDCREVVYIDKISRSDAEKQYPNFDLEKGTIADYCGVDRQKEEYEEVTFWEKTDSGVKIYKFIGGNLADETELPFSRIPIIRILGKKVNTICGENWRGIPFPVRNLLDTLTFMESLLQERIACAPNATFLLAEESASTHETAAQWAKINGGPRACIFYRAVTDGGVVLPPPIKIDKNADIQELSVEINNKIQTINATVGSVAGSPPTAGTETAESVLLRRENKENAADEFLRNLLTGAQTVATLIQYFYAMLGYESGEIIVQESIFEKAKKQADGQKIIALVSFLSQNPQSADFAAAMLETLDLEEDSKNRVLDVINTRKQKEAQDIAQMQMAIQQGAAENQELKNALAVSQKQVQDLQYANFEMQSDSTARIEIEKMKAEKDIEIERMQLQFKYDELGIKANTEAAKADNNAAKTEIEGAKAANEIANDQIAQIENAAQVALQHPTDGGFV